LEPAVSRVTTDLVARIDRGAPPEARVEKLVVQIWERTRLYRPGRRDILKRRRAGLECLHGVDLGSRARQPGRRVARDGGSLECTAPKRRAWPSRRRRRIRRYSLRDDRGKDVPVVGL